MPGNTALVVRRGNLLAQNMSDSYGDVGRVLLFMWQKLVLQAPGLAVSATAGCHQESVAAAHLGLELEWANKSLPLSPNACHHTAVVHRVGTGLFCSEILEKQGLETRQGVKPGWGPG